MYLWMGFGSLAGCLCLWQEWTLLMFNLHILYIVLNGPWNLPNTYLHITLTTNFYLNYYFWHFIFYVAANELNDYSNLKFDFQTLKLELSWEFAWTFQLTVKLKKVNLISHLLYLYSQYSQNSESPRRLKYKVFINIDCLGT